MLSPLEAVQGLVIITIELCTGAAKPDSLRIALPFPGPPAAVQQREIASDACSRHSQTMLWGLIIRLWRAMLASLLSLLRVGVWTCDRGAGRALPHSPWPALAMQETSGTTLTLTGVLGLAAVVCALCQLRGGPGKLGLRTMRVVSDLRAGAWGACPCSAAAACCRSCRSALRSAPLPVFELRCAPLPVLSSAHLHSGRKTDDGNPPSQQRERTYDPAQPSTSAAAAQHAAAAQLAAAATPAVAVARRLAGVRRVTLSVPGVLLEEHGAEELEESANVRAGAAGEDWGWRLHPHHCSVQCTAAINQRPI